MGLWPDTVPFDTSDGAHPPALGDIVHGPAAALTAVALVAGPAARASGWAATAAVRVAREWPRARRPVLVDATGLLGPGAGLHDAAGVSDDEGLIDVVSYGVTLRSVRQHAGGFDVVPAGLYVPEPAALRDPAVWDQLQADAVAGQLTLLAWLPAGEPGTAQLARRLGAVLVLAEADEARDVVESLGSPYSVLAVLTPVAPAEPAIPAATPPEQDDEGPAAPPPAAAGTASPAGGAEAAAAPPAPRVSDEDFQRIRLPTDRAEREALMVELRDRQRSARMAVPLDVPAEPAGGAAPGVVVSAGTGDASRELRVETAADDVALDTLDPWVGDGDRRETGGSTAPRRPGPSRGMIWTLVVLLAVSALAGSWRFLQGRLGFGVAVDQPVPMDTTALPADAAPVPTREVELGFAVAMEAHTDLGTAFRRLEALADEDRLSFHIAPLERDGALYYHIMAGPAPDSASALALRDTLLARRLKTAATPTDVRHAPLAFLVGDFGDLDGAEQSMVELRRLDVPSYYLLGDAADGRPLYRVYVGGFATPAEADVTRQLLRAAGVQDSLVTRTGIIYP